MLKIDYENGAGTGNILWRLGEGGDFVLQGATDPTDWFYAQHYAEFTSANTTGIFSPKLFDNGDDRMVPAGTICGPLPRQFESDRPDQPNSMGSGNTLEISRFA